MRASFGFGGDGSWRVLLTSSRGRKEEDVAGGPYASCFLGSCVSVFVGRELPRGHLSPGSWGLGGGAVTQKVG